ncbi:MAG: hypothetical protein QOE76_2379 [Frankiales bacterium]|nr:hypothetical protein [Frankiales bacterium]
MEVVDILGAVAFVGCLLVVGIVARRSLLRRTGATLDLCLRYPGTTATGWALGVAKLGDDRLLWYRVFSFAPRPKVSIARGGFEVRERRRPAHAEGLSLMAGAVVVGAASQGRPVELALAEPALPGLLAWLESAPPGATLPDAV